MELNELVKRAHETAVRHRFWEPVPEIGTSIATRPHKNGKVF